MLPAPPLVELAVRLRRLRLEQSAGSKLTQGDLGRALGGDKPLSAATIASWENGAAPKLPPRERLLAYAQFFATPRSMTAPLRLHPLDGFSGEELAAYESLRDELLRLHAATLGKPEQQFAAGRSWHFSETARVTLVCAELPAQQTGPLASPGNANYTELHSYGDLDSLLELWGHIRMENPAAEVGHKSAPHVKADHLSGHLVIIGGIGWNGVTRRVLEMARLPVTQQYDPAVETGEIFVAEIDGEEHRYLPVWSDTEPAKLVEDVGLLIRMPNPINSNRTLTMCNGVHSRGVYGAVRSLTDKSLRDSNERYIAENFSDTQRFCILMRVPVIEGEAMTPDFSIAENVLYKWPSAPGEAPSSARVPRAGR